jgi:TM2 domain-containing membrane protein YozV
MAADSSSQPATGSPAAAILTGLLVPGLPQFRAGLPVRGLLAFATVVVPYFVGVLALGPRFWFFAVFDTDESSGGGVFGVLSMVLHVVGTVLPEALAIGPSIVASVMLRPGAEPAFERLERMPVAGEEWFAILTSAAGILAALWAADAAWHATGRPRFDARAPEPPRAAAWSWFLPGAGQVMVGRAIGDNGLERKGLLVGAAVLALFLLGGLFSGFQAVDRGNHHVWWIGEVFAGLPWMLFAAISSMKLSALPWGYDLGIALCTTSGLLNVILAVDAYTLAEKGPPKGEDSRPAGSEREASA